MQIPSIIEITGITTGLASVFFAIRAHVSTWYVGIISQIAYFIIFYESQLYSDMFLQIFYTVLCVYGIVNWGKSDDLPVTTVSKKELLRDFCILVFSVFLWGNMMKNLPVWLPTWFPEPAALPFVDGAIGVFSVMATVYQARKKLESWGLWLIVNCIAIPLYWYRGLQFTTLLYLVFLVMAFVGFYNWKKITKNQRKK